MYNFYEERIIENKNLPIEWQSSLNEIEEFLQENWDNRYSFYNDGNLDKKQQFLSFLSHNNVRTKNYIGTICFKGKAINIFPKVFREKYNDDDTSNLDINHMLRNITLWINYCKKNDYPFINFDTEYDEQDSLKELFVSIYLKYVDEVLSRNTFYKYESIEEDIDTIRGRFNVNDYITKKIPQGKTYSFNCEFSTFEFDNTVNRIIKYVCRMLFNSTSVDNQKKIRNIMMKLNNVTDVVCVSSDCDKIILNKSQTIYKTILSMSKMFLLNQVSSFMADDNDNFCFLFPTEVLYEGFIGGFLTEMLEGKGIVKLQYSQDYLFENLLLNSVNYGSFLKVRYDIFIELDDGRLFIFDTKYKMLSRFHGDPDWKFNLLNELNSSDIYQVLTYANKKKLKDVYLLYPLIRKEDVEPSSPVGISASQEGMINVHIVKLPFVFEDDESIMKDRLKKELERIIL